MQKGIRLQRPTQSALDLYWIVPEGQGLGIY